MVAARALRTVRGGAACCCAIRDPGAIAMATLIISLTVAGYTEYAVYFAPDVQTCDRWGATYIAAGEATAYKCIT